MAIEFGKPNSFLKGLNKDVDKNLQPKESYRDAKNMRVYGNNNDGGSISVIKGNTKASAIPSVEEIIKLTFNNGTTTTLTNKYIQITNFDPGYGDVSLKASTFTHEFTGDIQDFYKAFAKHIRDNSDTDDGQPFKEGFNYRKTNAAGDDEKLVIWKGVGFGSGSWVANFVTYTLKTADDSGISSGVSTTTQSAGSLLTSGDYFSKATYVSAVSSTDNKPMGYKEFPDFNVLITGKDSAGLNSSDGMVWKVYAESNGLNLKFYLKYAAAMTLNHSFELKSSNKCIVDGVIENDCYERIYWADGVNDLRSLNLADNDIMCQDVTTISVFPQQTNGQITLQKVNDTGNLLSGMYQFALRQKILGGTKTAITHFSQLIPAIGGNVNTDDVWNISGLDPTDNTGKSLSLRAANLDKDFESVEVYVIHYETLNSGPSSVKILPDIPLPNNGIIEFTYSGTELTTPGSIDDLVIDESSFNIVKDIAIKDNRLFAANLKTSSFDLSGDFDSRCYRYKATGGTLTLSNGSGGSTTSTLSNWIDYGSPKPNEYDSTHAWAINPSTHASPQFEKFSGRTNPSAPEYDNSDSSSQTDYIYLPQTITDDNSKAQLVLGGQSDGWASGNGIRYGFRPKRYLVNHKRTYIHPTANATSNHPFTNFNNWHGNSPLTDFKHLDDLNNYSDNHQDAQYPQSFFRGPISPYWNDAMRGYQRRETYRFGIVFYNKRGTPGFVQWIDDIRMPDFTDYCHRIYIKSNGDWGIKTATSNGEVNKAYPPDWRTTHQLFDYADGNLEYSEPHQLLYAIGLHPVFDVRLSSTVLQKISGYSIVRVKRDEPNRTVICQGVGCQTQKLNTVDFSGDVTHSVLGGKILNRPLPTTLAATTTIHKGTKLFGWANSSVNGGAQGYYVESNANNLGWKPAYTFECPDIILGTRAEIVQAGNKFRCVDILSPKMNATDSKNTAAKIDDLNTISGLNYSWAGQGWYSRYYGIVDETTTGGVRDIIWTTLRSTCPQWFNIGRQNPATKLFNSGNDVNIINMTIRGDTSDDSWNGSHNKNVNEVTIGNVVYMQGSPGGAAEDAYEIISTSETGLAFVFANAAMTNSNNEETLSEAAESSMEDGYAGNFTKDWDPDWKGATGNKSLLIVPSIDTDNGTQIEIDLREPNDGFTELDDESGLGLSHPLAGLLTGGAGTGDPGHLDDSTTGGKVLKWVHGAMLVNIEKTVSNQYGGTSDSAFSNNRFISTGHFQPTKEAVDNYWSALGGGDTFITMFTYSKLDSRCTDDKKASGMVYEAPIESYCATELRTGHFFTKDGYSRDIPEDYFYNHVYSQENDTKSFVAKPLGLCSDDLHFPTTIAVSDLKLIGNINDAWLNFAPFNFYEVDSTYGDITNIFNLRDDLFFIQEKAFGQLTVNPAAIIPSSTAAAVNIVTGAGNVIDRDDYISTIYGSQNQHGLVLSDLSAYWIDKAHSKVFKYSKEKGFISLSDSFGMKNYFLDKLKEYKLDDSPLVNNGVHGVYDYENNELLFTITTSEGSMQAQVTVSGEKFYTYKKVEEFTIAFGEQEEAFIGEHSSTPDFYMNMDNYYYSSFVTAGRDGYGSLWLHNKGDYCKFYNTVQDSYVTIIVNDNSFATKTFDILDMVSTGSTYNSSVTTDSAHRLKTIELSSNFNTSSQTIDNTSADETRYKIREGKHTVPARALTATERMRGTYLEAKLTKDNSDNVEFRIFAVTTKYRVSKR